MTYRENYERWLSSDKVDEATKAELRAIADNDEEIRFRFVKDLEFGTGGLRGTMMAGTNAMNVGHRGARDTGSLRPHKQGRQG